jgi:signal transduction histidine kinase/CHASE3 domain sensor protein
VEISLDRLQALKTKIENVGVMAQLSDSYRCGDPLAHFPPGEPSMKNRRDNLLRLGFGIALLILFLLGSIFYWTTRRLMRINALVLDTHTVVENLSNLLTDVYKGESAARGYVMSGEDRYFNAYQNAIAETRTSLENLEHTIANTPEQKSRLRILKSVVNEKINSSNQKVELRRSQGHDSAVTFFMTDQDRLLLDNIRSVISEMKTEELGILHKRQAEEDINAKWSFVTMILGLILSFSMLFAVYYHLEREIVRRRRSESNLVQLNRLYTVLYHVNQTTVRIQDRLTLFNEVCRAVVEYGGFRMAWIGFVENNGNSVNPVAWAGEEQGYLKKISISLTEDPYGRGPTGNALREGQHFVCDDIASDQRMRAWREDALIRGFLSSAAFPIKLHGKVIGALSVYASEPNLFNTKTVFLLDEVASDISFALENLKREELRKQAEAEAKRLNEDLEHRVEERTAELADVNRQLEDRNREVEHANRMKSEFLARMSHELRTPLNAIIGFSDLLAEESAGPLSEKQSRFIGHVRAGARHLLQLINDVLDVSKIEAGKIDLSMANFVAADAIIEVMSVIRPLAESKGIQTDSKVGNELVIHADRIRFKQILYNLLTNAVKFTQEEGKVSIEAFPEKDFVRICVSDTGIGISPEEQVAIFEEFHQVGGTTKNANQGTGLGLTITRRLVELHGGRIWVESKPDSGSQFSFTIPIALAA